MLAGIPDDAGLTQALDHALAVGGAGWRARMLATVPSNIKNPQWLAEQADALAEEAGLALPGLGRAPTSRTAASAASSASARPRRPRRG